MKSKITKEVKLKASEHAREDGKNPLDFLWWDTNEGLITKDRYKKIKHKVYGGR